MGFERLNASLPNPRAVFLLAAALALPAAAVGVSEIAGKEGSGPVTVWRVEGRLNPSACDPANAPLHEIPDTPGT